MLIREQYLKNISKFINKPVIKVITGLRRSGKSFFIKQIIEKLKKDKVSQKNILYINKESVEFDFIVDYKDLVNYIKKTLKDSKEKKYLFIDEIQEIDSWEKAVASFLLDESFDIYISGSNANLLSSELSTLLSGRYINFPIFTLSFKEYVQSYDVQKDRLDDVFVDYLKYGGFPGLLHFDKDDETVFQYINALYDTIILNDVIHRHNIRNVGLLKNIARFVFDNIGNTFSSKTVNDYLKKEKLDVGTKTVQNYLEFIVQTFALYKVERFDIKGKRLLEVHEKYYLGDIGLRHALLGYRESDIAGILENIVFLELKRRGYNVHIGKFGDQEIDFIATKANEKLYIQVAYLLASEKTIEREFSVLSKISDNYPKFVISMDKTWGSDLNGVKRLNLLEFLLSDTLG